MKTQTGYRLRTLILLFALGMAAVGLVSTLPARTAPAPAATIVVNTTDDELTPDGDCSLREAIQAANTDAPVDSCPAGSGADTITLPAGTYVFALSGEDEDANATGDLDILDDLTLLGAGASATIIDGNALDRIVHIPGSATTVLLKDVTLRNGQVNNKSTGGGVLNAGNLTLKNCSIRDNLANGIAGGLRNQGTLTIEGCTINNNRAAYVGTPPSGFAGGLMHTGTHLTIFNSTIGGNFSNVGTAGLDIRASAVITHTTIANNLGDGITAVGTTVQLANTIIAHGDRKNCVSVSGGAFQSNGYNLEDDDRCNLTATTDITNTNPLLEPLTDNGGEVQTYALPAGSPALDAIPDGTHGCGTAYPADQRGVARPQDGDDDGIAACDIGAYEYLSADLGITKESVRVGSAITFTAVVTNAGPANVDAVVSDTLPAEVSNAAWTCATGGATCGGSGSGDISDAVNLPVDGVITYTITAEVEVSGPSMNTIAVLPAETVVDLNLANNTASTPLSYHSFLPLLVSQGSHGRARSR